MKKKLLSIILMVALVISMVAAIAACKTNGVEEAAEAYRHQHITDSYNKTSYDLPATYDFEGTTYTITWTANIDNVKFTKSADGKTVTVTATRTAEVQNYKLTATFADEKGNTKAVEFNGTIPANPNAGGEYGDPFYLYMDQINLGKIEWLKNTIASNIEAIETSDKKEDAVEYFFEDVAGQQGKKLFFFDGTTKKYIDAVADGKYYNVAIAASTNVLWTVNADNILVTTLGEKDYFLGTNGTYFTATIKELDDLSKSFPVKKAGLDDVINPAAVITVSGLNENCTVTITEPTPVDGKVVTTIGATIKFTVTPDTDCTIDSVKLAGKTVTGTNNAYTATVEKSGAIVVETTNPNAREENLTKRLAINASLPVVNSDKTQSVITLDGVTITNTKNESTTPCYSGAATNSARFYKDSALKIEFAGMLRVVFTMDNGYGAEGFDGLQIAGARVLADGTKAIVIFDNAANELTIAKLAAQIRVNQIEIYTAEEGGIKTEPEHAGTEADPYSADDAKLVGGALDDKAFTATEVYVKAYIIAADYEEYNSQYKNISFWLSDTPNGEKMIQVFRGTLADEIKIPYVGDFVLVKGFLQRYGTTVEFSTNNSVKPVVTVVEQGNGSIKASADNETGVTVTFTSPAAVDGVVSGVNGTEVKFTVNVNVGGKELDVVKVGDKEVQAGEGGIYTVALNGNQEIKVALKEGGLTTLHTVTFTKAEYTEGTNQYNASWNHQSGGVALFIENFSNNNKGWDGYIKAGNKTLDIIAKISTKNAIAESIRSIVVSLDSVNATYITEVYVEVSSTSDFANVSKIPYSGTLSKGDLNFTITNPAAGLFYRICVNCVKGSSTNGNISISKIEFRGIGSTTPATPEAKIGEGENATEYATLAEAIKAAQAGDTIVLQKDVTLNSQIVISKAITLDMNGKTIANTEAFRDDANAIYGFFALLAGGNLTVKGNGQMLAKANDVRTITLWDENAVLTIENGKFVGNVENIYVWKGTVYIKGGEFDVIELDADKVAAGGTGHEFTLNLHDSNGKEKFAKIIVTGGTFVEYDPSNSASEAPAADFVAEGYVVTSSTVGDKTIYTVAAAQA